MLTALGAASSGANSTITSLSGLTTALSIAQGGTGATTASAALTALGAASSASLSGYASLSAANTFAAAQTMRLAVTGATTLSSTLTVTSPASISLGTSGSNWTAWTPTYTPSGSTTMTAPSSVTAKYLRIGPVVHFRLQFTTTFGGTLTNQVSVSVPVAEFLVLAVACPGQFVLGSAYSWCGALANGSTLYVNGTASFTAASYTFYLSWTYQCAG